MAVIITNHAGRRMKRRLGLPKSAHAAAAQLAFDQGAQRSEAAGKLKSFLDRRWLRYQKADNIRVHAEYIWFFAGETLLTVYKAPRSMHASIKEMER